MASEEEVQLFNEIIAKGCCRRCALRYMGHCKTLISFEYPSTSLVNFGLLSPMEEFEPATKIRKTSPCTVCLGVLQDSVIDAMLAHDNLATAATEYQHKSFVAYLTFPTCVILRDHSMQLHLRRTFPHFIGRRVMKINHAWRYSIEKRLCKLLKKKLQHAAKLTIHFHLEYSLEEDEMSVVEESVNDGQLSRHQVLALVDSLSDEEFSKLVTVPPKEPFFGVELKDVKLASDSIHVMGKYRKYSRELAQVPVMIKGEIVMRTSVESMILDVVRDVAGGFSEMLFKASNFDYPDFRVLGNGRTFHLQLNEPKFESLSPLQCKKIEDTLKKSEVMEVKNLRQTDKKDITVALDSEQLSPCSFRLLCIVYQCKNIDYCVNAVNMYESIMVAQKTPIRLLHHRHLARKKKKIYHISAKKVGDDLIEVDLCAENGFYIREFVNGDFGRTVPSLGDIMKAKVGLLAVDVVDFQSALPCATEEDEVEI